MKFGLCTEKLSLLAFAELCSQVIVCLLSSRLGHLIVVFLFSHFFLIFANLFHVFDKFSFFFSLYVLINKTFGVMLALGMNSIPSYHLLSSHKQRAFMCIHRA